MVYESFNSSRFWFTNPLAVKNLFLNELTNNIRIKLILKKNCISHSGRF